MNQLMRESPIHGEKWISIHDMHISQIVCRENSVVFCFNEGFDLIEEGKLLRTGSASIELIGCNPQDISCKIIKRKPSNKGEKICGKPISLEKINKMLTKKKQCIEIFLELYNTNCMYWRGELLPYTRKDRFMPYVTIETMDFYPMVYRWE
ncbi:MAG: hypothetical protein IJK56_04885 [Firmicutes bacterium]|nr:hypothetical protein [Bacillota bacterium]